jgi:hypothetical protein
VFVNAQGVKRAYKFKPSDSRVLEEQALALPCHIGNHRALVAD